MEAQPKESLCSISWPTKQCSADNQGSNSSCPEVTSHPSCPTGQCPLCATTALAWPGIHMSSGQRRGGSHHSEEDGTPFSHLSHSTDGRRGRRVTLGSPKNMLQMYLLQVHSSRPWLRVTDICYMWRVLAFTHLAGKLHILLVLTCAQYTDMRRCTWGLGGLFPVERGLIPRCLPPIHPMPPREWRSRGSSSCWAVQPVPTLRPLAAESTTCGRLQSPTLHSLESHLHILRPERPMRITCKGLGYPCSVSEGMSLTQHWKWHLWDRQCWRSQHSRDPLQVSPSHLHLLPQWRSSHAGPGQCHTAGSHPRWHQAGGIKQQRCWHRGCRSIGCFLLAANIWGPSCWLMALRASTAGKVSLAANPPVPHWAWSIPGSKSGNRNREQMRVTAVAKCWECSSSPTPSLYWSLSFWTLFTFYFRSTIFLVLGGGRGVLWDYWFVGFLVCVWGFLLNWLT